MTLLEHNTQVLLGIINLLSVLLIGVIGYFLKELWNDIKILKREFTILQTEHRIQQARCTTHEEWDQRMHDRRIKHEDTE